jgi:hypothetical protein
MTVRTLFRKGTVVPVLLVGGLGAGGMALRELAASDHQQTALTELSPRLDINDVWVFPGSSDDRIALAMTVGSPIAGTKFAGTGGNQTANFDPNALYQFKIDNNQDGDPDLVIQFSFDQLANGTQTVDVIGPVVPRDVGAFGSTVRDAFATGTPNIRRGAMDTNLTTTLAATGSATTGEMQVFTGLRDDPFYIDLEQFFRIVPDRRPTQGPLSSIGGTNPAAPGTLSASFRPACTNGTPNAGQSAFSAGFGCAVDFLRGLNALTIVVELPESQLVRGGNGQLGVWATVGH